MKGRDVFTRNGIKYVKYLETSADLVKYRSNDVLSALTNLEKLTGVCLPNSNGIRCVLDMNDILDTYAERIEGTACSLPQFFLVYIASGVYNECAMYSIPWRKSWKAVGNLTKTYPLFESDITVKVNSVGKVEFNSRYGNVFYYTIIPVMS